MEGILGVIFLGSVVALAAGLVRPDWVMPWAQTPARGKAAGLYGTLAVASVIAGGIVVEQNGGPGTSSNDRQAVAATDPSEGAAQAGDKAVSDRIKSAWAALDKSDEMQARREDVIQRLKSRGVITRVERPTRYPRVYVGEAWRSLSLEDKERFINSVLTYYFAQDPAASAAIIRDGRSGDELGNYSYRQGLALE